MRVILSFTRNGAGHASRRLSTLRGASFFLPEFKPYPQPGRASWVHVSGCGEDHKKFERLVDGLAVKLKELDIDRVFVDAAMAEIHRLNGAARAGASYRGSWLCDQQQGVPAVRGERVLEGGSGQRAKNEFVKGRTCAWLMSIARRFNHGRLPLPDLIQEGNIGLMKAVERYDYRARLPFFHLR